MASSDAIELLDRAVRGFLDEVPALKDLKLVVGVDLNGRGGDVQQFRIEMPDLDIRKDMGTDAKIRIEMRRDFFNLMVEHGAKVDVQEDLLVLPGLLQGDDGSFWYLIMPIRLPS